MVLITAANASEVLGYRPQKDDSKHYTILTLRGKASKKGKPTTAGHNHSPQHWWNPALSNAVSAFPTSQLPSREYFNYLFCKILCKS